MSKFCTIDTGAFFKEAPCEEGCIPQNHPARFILEVVSQLDLSAFERAYRGCGSKAYPPLTMLALLVYGYTTGVFSSRKVEAATHDSIAFRFLAGNTHPDHTSLAEFRKRFKQEFANVFQQVLAIAHGLKLVQLGTVSLDGTKVLANASKHTAMSYGHAERIEAQLKAEVARLMALAEQMDNSERPQGLNFPAEIARRQERLVAIAAVKAELEQRAALRDATRRAEYEAQLARRAEKEARTGKKPGGKPPGEPPRGAQPRDQVSLTDGESRIMPVSGGGFEQAYNAQAAVDTASMLIVAAFVTQASNDKEQLVPALQALGCAPAALGKATALLADSGYHSAGNVAASLAAQVEPLVPARRERHHPGGLERFTEPAALPVDASPVARVAHRLKTRAGRALYALRKQTVEPVFGIIKSVMRFRQFSMRGLASVQGEWNLVCLSYNLKRMAVLRLR